jgi:hypothetical protein
MRRREEWKKKRKGKERKGMGAVCEPREKGKKENERWRIKGLGVMKGIREKNERGKIIEMPHNYIYIFFYFQFIKVKGYPLNQS